MKLEYINRNKFNFNKYERNSFSFLLRLSKKEELQHLYAQIIQEIDERYIYMDEMKKLGNNKDQIIMGEIKERLDELKKR